MKYSDGDGSTYEACECGMKTYRQLEIHGHKIPICGKCVCQLFIISKKQMDGSEESK